MEKGHQIRICIISTIKNAHIIRWCRILVSKDYDIFLISSEHDNWGISGIKVIECIPFRSKLHLCHLFHQLVHCIKIHIHLKRIKPDVVHIHSLDYFHPFIFSILNLIIGKKNNLIISTWGSDIVENYGSNSRKRGKLAKRLLLKQAAEITATSKYLAFETAFLAHPKKSIHVIPFGIDLRLFCKKKEKKISGKICIGFIKHLKSKYGPDYLLRAFADIISQFPETQLIMIGHGEMEYELKQLACELRIKDKVQFKGYIQNEKLPSIMEDLDIFVMPSIVNEAFGVAAIEAQAMEIPVVAFDVGGVCEAILDGKSGILVEPKNVQKLSQAILKLIENPQERKRMGKAGREFVLGNYNLENNISLFENLYKNMSLKN